MYNRIKYSVINKVWYVRLPTDYNDFNTVVIWQLAMQLTKLSSFTY